MLECSSVEKERLWSELCSADVDEYSKESFVALMTTLSSELMQREDYEVILLKNFVVKYLEIADYLAFYNDLSGLPAIFPAVILDIIRFSLEDASVIPSDDDHAWEKIEQLSQSHDNLADNSYKHLWIFLKSNIELYLSAEFLNKKPPKSFSFIEDEAFTEIFDVILIKAEQFLQDDNIVVMQETFADLTFEYGKRHRSDSSIPNAIVNVFPTFAYVGSIFNFLFKDDTYSKEEKEFLVAFAKSLYLFRNFFHEEHVLSKLFYKLDVFLDKPENNKFEIYFINDVLGKQKIDDKSYKPKLVVPYFQEVQTSFPTWVANFVHPGICATDEDDVEYINHKRALEHLEKYFLKYQKLFDWSDKLLVAVINQTYEHLSNNMDKGQVKPNTQDSILQFVSSFKEKGKGIESGISHPLDFAVWVHREIVKRPFFKSCNGRLARAWMNAILLRYGFLPVIFEQETLYLDAVKKDLVNPGVFENFLIDSMFWTIEKVETGGFDSLCLK